MENRFTSDWKRLSTETEEAAQLFIATAAFFLKVEISATTQTNPI